MAVQLPKLPKPPVISKLVTPEAMRVLNLLKDSVLLLKNEGQKFATDEALRNKFQQMREEMQVGLSQLPKDQIEWVGREYETWFQKEKIAEKIA